jgi:hypothetical protein
MFISKLKMFGMRDILKVASSVPVTVGAVQAVIAHQKVKRALPQPAYFGALQFYCHAINNRFSTCGNRFGMAGDLHETQPA